MAIGSVELMQEFLSPTHEKGNGRNDTRKEERTGREGKQSRNQEILLRPKSFATLEELLYVTNLT